MGFQLTQAQCPPAGDITFDSQISIDAFILLYPNCTKIDGNVTVEGADINNFYGLQKIENITGNLIIQNNPALTILSWLDNLTYIGGHLDINNNNNLVSFEGLSGLQTVRSFIIFGNPKLEGFKGGGAKPALGELTSVGYLHVANNAVLTSLAGLEKVTSVEGLLRIWNNTKLTSLTGLGNVESVAGDLEIGNSAKLTSLTGLEKVTSVGGGLVFRNNAKLTSLAGLEKVTSVDGLWILFNAKLTSLTGLENIEYVRMDLEISGNNELTSLAGLENITSFGGFLSINYNNRLTDISGIKNIDPADIKSQDPTNYNDLNIFNNPLLSECVPTICAMLAYPNLTSNIHNNATGCNSTTEAETACTPPPCSHLTNPVDGAMDVKVNSNISWSVSTGATGYWFTVGTTLGGSEIISADMGNATTWDPPSDFDCGVTIYTNITPYKSGQITANCAGESFQTEEVTASAGNDVTICLNSSTQLHASGGTEYSWSPATGLSDPNIADPVANPIVTTVYTVRVSNANGCFDTYDVGVIVNPLPVPNASATDETGNNFNDGTVTCSPGGVAPYTYSWSNGGNTQNITGLAPGSYTVTVTDANGCTAEATVSIAKFGCQNLSVNISQTNVSCNGECDGTLSVTDITNGTSPFTYAWNNGQTTQTVTGLCAEDYTVTVTDANNCSVVSGKYTISEPPQLKFENIIINNISESNNTGSIEVAVIGGTSPYSYNWTGVNAFSSNLQNINNLLEGCYYLLVTDANNCTAAVTDSLCIDDLSTAISEIKNELDLRIYPNPASNILYLKYNKKVISSFKELRTEIYSISGRKIKYSEPISDEIDISNLEEGIYFVNIKTNKSAFCRKIVIIR